MKKGSNTYTRKLSPTERVWLVADSITTPFANQFVIEGVGELDENRWHDAVDAACEANPGSRIVLKGILRFSRWVDSGLPAPVRSIQNSAWSGYSSDNAPFLQKSLSFKKSPSCEVVLVHGNPCRIIFRSHHAAMDGRGTQHWAEDIFRALRKEPLVGSSSTLIDLQIAKKPKKKPRYGKEDCIVPTGLSDGDEPGVIWKRITLQQTYSSLLPKLAVLIATYARKSEPGRVRLNIPVDMRKHVEGVRSTANLTGIINLEINSEATPYSIKSELTSQIKNRTEVPPCPYPFVNRIPLKWMTAIGKKGRDRGRKNSRFSGSGVLSNLGHLPMDLFSDNDFKAQTGFFIPPGLDGTPFFGTAAIPGDFTELAVAVPKVFATNNRLDKLFKFIKEGLMTK